MLEVELLRSPAHGLAPLFARAAVPGGFHAGHLREDFAVTIAVDKLHGNVQAEQRLESFPREWAGKDVATDDNAVHVGLTDVLEYGFQRRKVGMNVVEGRYAHDRVPRIGR